MNNFDDAFQEVIGLEGGYVNDPDDSGGETKFGISKRAFPNEDITNLTLGRARQIYYTQYWIPLKLHAIPNRDVCIELFEQGINMGLTRAVTHLQDSLNLLGKSVIVDGIIGDQTVSAVNTLQSREIIPLLKCLNGFQFMKYLEIVQYKPSQKKYFVGWLKRIDFSCNDPQNIV